MQFQTSGIELRHEDAVGNELHWSSNLQSNIMRDDNSILSFQGINKLQQNVPSQPGVDACDTVVTVCSVPARNQSVFTQTKAPGRADDHLNTEASMADLRWLTEVRTAAIAGK